jgi:Common central domain of tyrosinase
MKKSTIIFFSSLFCCIPKETAAQQQQSQQRCPLTRERKPWKDLSCSEQNEYLASIRRLKDNGLYDEFVQVHIQNEAASHGTPEFLPWHRWFIYQFESALRQVSADPCITLPYWDWENDAGKESRSHIFDGDAFGSFAGMDVRTGRCGWTTAAGGCLQRDMDPSFPFWSQSRLVGLMTRYSQYADDFPNNPDRNNGFRAAFEAGPRKYCDAKKSQAIKDGDSSTSTYSRFLLKSAGGFLSRCCSAQYDWWQHG